MSVNVDYFCPSAYPVMIDPSLRYAWIDIPKCASSFIQKVLYDNNWTSTHDPVLMDGIKRAESVEKIVVLRDPVERWVSGFSECWHSTPSILNLLDQPTFWKTIYANPVFDDHTEHQHRFVRNAVNIKYIYMTAGTANADRFHKNLATWIRAAGYSANFDNWTEPTNPKTNHDIKLQINTKLHTMFKDHPDLMENLINVHRKDYGLFETLKKYKAKHDSTN